MDYTFGKSTKLLPVQKFLFYPSLHNHWLFFLLLENSFLVSSLTGFWRLSGGISYLMSSLFSPSQFLEPFARDPLFGGSSAFISVPRRKQEDEAGTASSHPGHFRVLVSSWEVSFREFMKWSFLFYPSLAVKCRLEDYLYHLTNM